MSIVSESTISLKPADFELLEQSSKPDFSWQKTETYWQEVWSRLKKNYRAVLSLYLILLLVIFSTLGPFIWKINPAEQDLSQISQAPSLFKKAIIHDSSNRLVPIDLSHKVDQLQVEGLAHTERVILRWPEKAEIDFYKIYRHEYQPTGINDLGLPLAEVFETFYQDRLNLEPIWYYYSVVSMKDGDILDHQTVGIKPVTAVQKSLANEKISQGLWKKIKTKDQENETETWVELSAHPMGTDYLGRDMMSRLMYGGQTSLLIALAASIAFVLFGSVYGAASAYIGGKTDNYLMRIADFVIALPFLLFMILLKVSFGIGPGESGIWVMIFSLVILSWPASARLVRSQALVLREQNFVLAARINGASTSYILTKHFAPNVLSLVLISLSFAIPSVMLTEAFLSFIGLGVVPPTPSWGAMCQEGIKSFLFHPHELIFPASFIGLTVLAFNLLGDGLRDALDIQVK